MITNTARDRVSRERVLSVARQLFLANGYAGTSLKAVAAELEISAPALYWYFPSKDDLFVSVVHQAMDDFTNYVRQSITDDEPLFKLSQLVRAHVTWQLRQSEITQSFDLAMALNGIGSGIPAARLTAITELQQNYVGQVRSILREGVQAGVFTVDDVKTTASTIVSLCEYVITWYKPDGEMSVTAVANRYERLVRNMVGAG